MPKLSNELKKPSDSDKLRGFRNFGVMLEKRMGNQAIGDCPFCAKEGHFYVNTENLLWDCKRCGESGNFEGFLSGVVGRLSLDDADPHGRLKILAKDRQMNRAALKGWHIGFVNDQYLLPIANSKGKVINIRTYRPGGKLLSTAGAHMGLFNLQELARMPAGDTGPVYLCEGEWDTMSMRWLLGNIKEKGVCVGVPGASTFKDNWVPFFEGKDVIALYDNDVAGQQGALKAREKLTGTVRSLQYIWWPDNLPSGFDIRDALKPVVRLEKNAQIAFDELQKCFKSEPPGVMVDGKMTRGVESAETAKGKVVPRVNQKPLEPIDLKGLIEGYKTWLHMPNLDAITVMYGAVLSNLIAGDPVWLFLVAPPGGSKSELLMSLADNKLTVAVSSLTPHTLISGMGWGAEGKDPSLLPKLDGRILIVKDFTTLLTLNQMARDEIFGVLRDVYDGSTEKYYGTGIRRSYNVHFGILAGVTPVIETFNIMHSSLGERFLKFRLTGNWDQVSELPKIWRAMGNLGKESGMRAGLQELANRWLDTGGLERAKKRIEEGGGRVEFGEWWEKRMGDLARFAARLRGVVERDKYRGTVLYKPSSEVGTRLAKQLTKLGMGIALFLDKKTIDDPEIYRLVLRAALDTVPDRPEEIVRTIWKMGEGPKRGYVKTKDIVLQSRLPQSTIFPVLQDMNLLRLVEKSPDDKVSAWRVGEKLAEYIVGGEIYPQITEGFIEKKVKFKIQRKQGVRS